MVNEGQTVDELTVAAPGRIAMSAPRALTYDLIAISYAAEVPKCDIASSLISEPLKRTSERSSAKVRYLHRSGHGSNCASLWTCGP